MRFSEYTADKAVTVCFLGVGALVLTAFLFFGNVPVGVIILFLVFVTFFTVLWLITGYILQNKRFEKLQKTLDDLNEKYLAGEVLYKPSGNIERKYFEIMKTISRAAVGETEAAKREKEEYCEYVESWIHEIKTPLCACSLILSNGSDVNKLKRELKRADNLTESILYYARLKSVEKDLQISKVSINDIMNEAVQSQMELLIAAKISVEVKGDFSVYTDGKPICFIIKQLLINCAKYCSKCHVKLTAADGVITVEDNGPGIPAHEIRRVTERGFTGSSGVRAGASTGMGLYIVNGLCEKLGLKLEIASEQGKYTKISISFPNISKM